MFKVGDKVVCIEPVGCLVKGGIYIIENIVPPITQWYGIVLVGIRADAPYGAYKDMRFRKLDDSFATEVLENIKEQIEEEELINI